jgi:hypothetical protein
MRVKEDLFSRGSFVLGNGSSIRFWEDKWLGDRPLAVQYPLLYNIVRHKDQMVAHTFATILLNIEFRRSLIGGWWDCWLHLLHRLIDVQFHPHDDEFKWSLTQSGSFTVKSMYLDLLNDNTIYLHKYLWKLKVPLKTKIFMWFVQRKEILTKDNLLKRNWQGSSKCYFCDHDESIQHIFIKCPFAKIIWQIWEKNIRFGICAILSAIWHVRNGFIFNKSCFPMFLQVIPLATHWIHMWSYLRSADQRRDLDIKCNRLETVAWDIYSRFSWRFDGRLTCWCIGLLWFFVSLDGWSMCPPYVIHDL